MTPVETRCVRTQTVMPMHTSGVAGVIANQWGTVTTDDIRPSVGMALFRLVTPFGAISIERAIPLRPQLGDDPRGRWHFVLGARTQF